MMIFLHWYFNNFGPYNTLSCCDIVKRHQSEKKKKKLNKKHIPNGDTPTCSLGEEATPVMCPFFPRLRHACMVSLAHHAMFFSRGCEAPRSLLPWEVSVVSWLKRLVGWDACDAQKVGYPPIGGLDLKLNHFLVLVDGRWGFPPGAPLNHQAPNQVEGSEEMLDNARARGLLLLTKSCQRPRRACLFSRHAGDPHCESVSWTRMSSLAGPK